MNYLAHIYLAQHHPDAQFGALLGDFVKMDFASQFNAQTSLEIQLHRKVDMFTDSHPIVQYARSLFQLQHRRYAGILLDVFYDHLLARNWQRYSDQVLEIFIADFYRELLARQDLFTERLSYAAPMMVAQNWLGSYIDFEGVKMAINRISTRLSRNGELLREGVDDLEANYGAFSAGFLEFFPELVTFSQTQRVTLAQLADVARK